MGVIDLLTVEEAAALLKTGRQQIRKMIQGCLITADATSV
ncbi:helix-turn-helix domain-containing protein [Intestinimonas aquisgranensis]|nr:helix-turn-helix domain-containing protein [Intestinimonas aquisgranensis]